MRTRRMWQTVMLAAVVVCLVGLSAWAEGPDEQATVDVVAIDTLFAEMNEVVSAADLVEELSEQLESYFSALYDLLIGVPDDAELVSVLTEALQSVDDADYAAFLTGARTALAQGALGARFATVVVTLTLEGTLSVPDEELWSELLAAAEEA